jgi:hypothetical protein
LIAYVIHTQKMYNNARNGPSDNNNRINDRERETDDSM